MDIGYDHFCIYFEGILSKTASYLTKHMQNAWTGSDETRLTEYGSLLRITPIANPASHFKQGSQFKVTLSWEHGWDHLLVVPVAEGHWGQAPTPITTKPTDTVA